MRGQMDPNYGLAMILLANDPLSSSTYPMIIYIPPATGKMPIKRGH